MADYNILHERVCYLIYIYVYCIIPSSLFTTIFFKRAKTVRLQELSAPFCGVLNELKDIKF